MKANILVVDDTPDNLRLLMGILGEQGYKVRPASDGPYALSTARAAPPDLILLDIKMPGMDGYAVCEQLKADDLTRDIPVLFISALNEPLDKVKAFETGGVDYVTKPFQVEEVLARVKIHVTNHRLQAELEQYNNNLQHLVQEQVKEISQAQMATIVAMSKLAESRDDVTGKHIERVRTFCKMLALKLKERPEFTNVVSAAYAKNVFYASPLHDIGKVAIPDNILLKPGKLTEKEFKTMQTHTIHGAQTLEAVRVEYPNNSFITMGVAIARSHHEKWNGTGYPDGLVGEDIPLSARIVAVADVYDALTTKRCYKEAFSHEKSCDIIYHDSGTHFDPRAVEAFMELKDEFMNVRQKLKDEYTSP